MRQPPTAIRMEGVLFGFVLGVITTLATVMGYHELAGLHRFTLWERSFEQRRLERSAELIQRHLEIAEAAISEGHPLTTSDFLASRLMVDLYRHHMAFAHALLSAGDVARFNQLRAITPWLLYDLSSTDLGNTTLTGVNLAAADLTDARLTGCDLSRAVLFGAHAPEIDLSGADLTGCSLGQANLAGANLNGVHGDGADFRDAILTNASLATVQTLVNARFDGAEMTGVNLWSSSFEGAHFDGASLTIASAVDADLSTVAGMPDVDLAGANLAGTTLAPALCQRAWLTNAQGLDSRTAAALRRFGAILAADEVLSQIDRPIIDGFRAQIAADPQIQPEQRDRVLLEMAKAYYLR